MKLELEKVRRDGDFFNRNISQFLHSISDGSSGLDEDEYAASVATLQSISGNRPLLFL